MCAVLTAAKHILKLALSAGRGELGGQIENVVLGTDGAGADHIAIAIIPVAAAGQEYAAGLCGWVGYYVCYALQFGTERVGGGIGAGVAVVQVVYEVIHGRVAAHAHKAATAEALGSGIFDVNICFSTSCMETNR